MNSSHKILPTNETNEKDNVVVDKNDLQIKPGNLARDKEHRSTTSLTNDRQSGIEDLEARIDLLLQAKNSRQRQTKVIQPNLKFRTPVNSNSNRNCCFYFLPRFRIKSNRQRDVTQNKNKERKVEKKCK